MLSLNGTVTVLACQRVFAPCVFLTCVFALEAHAETGGAPACERVRHVDSSFCKFQSFSLFLREHKDFMQLKGSALQI